MQHRGAISGWSGGWFDLIFLGEKVDVNHAVVTSSSRFHYKVVWCALCMQMMMPLVMEMMVMTIFLMVMMMMTMVKKWRVAGGGLEWVGWGWRRESRGGKLSVNKIAHCTLCDVRRQLYHYTMQSTIVNNRTAHCALHQLTIVNNRTAPTTIPSSQ